MISETSICNVCGVLNGMVEIARTDPFTYFKYLKGKMKLSPNRWGSVKKSLGGINFSVIVINLLCMVT